MAKTDSGQNPSGFGGLVSTLEATLQDVEQKREAHTAAKSAEAAASDAYQSAVKAVQAAHSAYQEYINKKVSGFAQTHQ